MKSASSISWTSLVQPSVLIRDTCCLRAKNASVEWPVKVSVLRAADHIDANYLRREEQARVAQWLEHWSSKPGVVSSILSSGIKFLFFFLLSSRVASQLCAYRSSKKECSLFLLLCRREEKKEVNYRTRTTWSIDWKKTEIRPVRSSFCNYLRRNRDPIERTREIDEWFYSLETSYSFALHRVLYGVIDGLQMDEARDLDNRIQSKTSFFPCNRSHCFRYHVVRAVAWLSLSTMHLLRESGMYRSSHSFDADRFR